MISRSDTIHPVIMRLSLFAQTTEQCIHDSVLILISRFQPDPPFEILLSMFGRKETWVKEVRVVHSLFTLIAFQLLLALPPINPMLVLRAFLLSTIFLMALA